MVARKVRTRLDALLAELKDLPARLRQYAAYDFVQSTLRYDVCWAADPDAAP